MTVLSPAQRALMPMGLLSTTVARLLATHSIATWPRSTSTVWIPTTGKSKRKPSRREPSRWQLCSTTTLWNLASSARGNGIPSSASRSQACSTFASKPLGLNGCAGWQEGRPDTPIGKEFKQQEREYLSRWKEIVHRVVWDYCDRHSLRRPNRCTTVSARRHQVAAHQRLSRLAPAQSPTLHPPHHLCQK
jgi:hypothetical protein